jgi:L-threonylcarbamoyladenylate synthase
MSLADAAAIAQAAIILRRGGLVAFPTETVYGLGADAANPEAVRKIFAAKRRPADHPVIVHLLGIDDVMGWASEIPAAARALMGRFWPGPLTLILKRAPSVSDVVTGGQDSVGVRVPSHPIARALLREFGGGIAAPSANRFGRISPTTAADVREELGSAVELVLDGGPCDIGIESTIVDFSSGTPKLLRPGGLSREEIEAAMHATVGRGDAGSPRASGTLTAHYAPRVRTLLVASANLDNALRAHADVGRIAVLARRAPPASWAVERWHRASAEARQYAHDLYATLRKLDRSGCELLIIEAPPPEPQWEAVRDRLQRAAAGSGASESETEDLP